ncbi:hypothetical protein OPQ81_002887 [Rhizoctonia solani]|nr:hypothetical protein OPQ81_002887 [Rhizoctonia solani]
MHSNSRHQAMLSTMRLANMTKALRDWPADNWIIGAATRSLNHGYMKQNDRVGLGTNMQGIKTVSVTAQRWMLRWIHLPASLPSFE